MALVAVVFQHFAFAVDNDRNACVHGFQDDEREAFDLRGIDDDCGVVNKFVLQRF